MSVRGPFTCVAIPFVLPLLAKALCCVCSYAGGYWEARAAAALGDAHAWQGCMDIMGQGL